MPYNLGWLIARRLRREHLCVLHIEDLFDWYLFQSIGQLLPNLDIVVGKPGLKEQLIPLLPEKTRIYVYPLCFPDAVIMFRNAAWKYPVPRVVKIGLEHGAYNFKKFPKAYYYNMFDLYLMTSFADERRLRAKGAASVKAIGYPKSDPLINGYYTAEKLAAFRAELGLDPDKTTLLFSSTWDGSGMSAIHKWFDKLPQLAADYNILVTLHPRMSSFYREHLGNVPQVHYVDALDIYPHLLLADVCIGDTNSLIAEFCIVDKPIITFSIEPTERTMDDVIRLIRSVSLQIDSFEQLPDAIAEALRTGKETSRARKEAIKTLIDPLDGKAGLRAAQEILRLIPELQP